MALYGHKQSCIAWFGRFTKATEEMKCQGSQRKSYLLHQALNSGKGNNPIVYIDGIIVSEDDWEDKISGKTIESKNLR